MSLLVRKAMVKMTVLPIGQRLYVRRRLFDGIRKSMR
jgi:hypothetical protein